jgi:hypothetical protein
MKLAKRVFTASITITLLLCAAAVLAQMEGLRNSTPSQRARLQTAFMHRKLNLSPQQVKQVQKINLKYAEQMDPIIHGNEGKFKKARQAEAINEAKDNELKTVLSEEQYQTYLASREEMRQRMVEKLKEKRAGAD